MTETPSGPGARRLAYSGVLDVLATLAAHVTFPSRHLESSIADYAGQIPDAGDANETRRKAVEGVDHLQTIHDWCVANPERAACCVLAAIYLLNGRFVVQEQAGDPAQEGPA